MRLRELVERERGKARELQAIVDATDRATLLVDRRLRVSRASSAAIALLDTWDDIALTNGVLAIEQQTARALLGAMVRETIAGLPPQQSALLCPRRSGRVAYRIVVLPAVPSVPDHAILMIDDPESAGTNRTAAFAQAYGLTPAEAALAEGLARGRTLQEISDLRRVTIDTTRSQLKSLFARTSTNRQSDLARLLVSFPGGPALGGD